jgi:hypothetical protein
MRIELAIAGLIFFVFALGHATVGLRWVLPRLSKERLPSTPFGPPSMTLGMVRFTWNVLTILQIAFGTLLTMLALATAADPRTLLLRWVAAVSLAVSLTACWAARRRPRDLLRLPVAPVMVAVAVMCWMASA